MAIGGVAVGAAGLLRVTAVEWAVLAVTIGLVLVTETVNTAVESLARAVDTGFHPRLRDALDISSAAVLLAAREAVRVLYQRSQLAMRPVFGPDGAPAPVPVGWGTVDTLLADATVTGGVAVKARKMPGFA